MVFLVFVNFGLYRIIQLPAHIYRIPVFILRIIVFKSFITRVGAGPLPGEITKEEAKKKGWFEKAAGTGRDRRSAPFDFKLAKKNARINGASQAALTKIDCVFPDCRSIRNYDELPREARMFVKEVEEKTKLPVTLIGTGPDALYIIYRRN